RHDDPSVRYRVPTPLVRVSPAKLVRRHNSQRTSTYWRRLMASFADAFSALDEYRSALLNEQHNEDPLAATAFAARGAFAAFATTLRNVHATGVGVRVRQGKIIEDDFVLKVYVFDKQDLGPSTPSITRGEFQGIGIDVEHLPVQHALASKGGAAKALAGTT